MPLFTVRLTVETVVYAEDESDARYVAREGLEAAMDDDLPHGADAYEVKSLRDLPPEWTAEALVWHEGSGDLTVADAIAGKVPKGNE